MYSFGVVIYELLTGDLPRGNVKKPSQINSTVPTWFDEAVFGLLEPDPSNRSWPPDNSGQTPPVNSLVGIPKWKWWLLAVGSVFVLWSVVKWFPGQSKQPAAKASDGNSQNASNPSETWLEHVGPDTLERLNVTEDEVLWKALGIRATFSPPSQLIVEEVKAGGAASQAGLRAGDVLTLLGGYRMPSKRIAAIWLARMRPESMSFTAVRGDGLTGKNTITGWLQPDRWR